MTTQTSPMPELTRDDLYSLEQYATRRAAFRTQVLAHKKLRTVHIGPHMTLIFEDRLTVQYQVQEMLRIERIFEAAGIGDELMAYNPLIPGGHDLKATMLHLLGIDHKRLTYPNQGLDQRVTNVTKPSKVVKGILA